MEFLKADYTEVWVPSVVRPLIQFADHVESLATTGIDLVGIGSQEDAGLEQRLRSFDQIVSWYGANRPEFRLAMQRLGADCVFHAALPQPDGFVHATDFFASQVGAPPGLVPKLQFNRAAWRGRVVLHPFSGSARKNWPLACFQELAGLLADEVDWLAGPEEQLNAAVHIEDLNELSSWLSGASAYVGNDSGITHLAAAIGLPTIAIFGPTDPRVWQPRGPYVKVLWHEPLDQLKAEAVYKVLTS